VEIVRRYLQRGKEQVSKDNEAAADRYLLSNTNRNEVGPNLATDRLMHDTEISEDFPNLYSPREVTQLFRQIKSCVSPVAVIEFR
jgi:hypothetical protein